jgi:transposase InsO family protein
VDFITQLPESQGHNAICVFVDRFTKMALFVPTTNEVNAEGTAKMFLEHVFCHFGLPKNVVSDRGATFTSKFFQAMMKYLQVQNHYSTAFHPQTDGQTERVNSILEQYLRCYINHQQSDWRQYLCLAQFSYNNSFHTSTNTSPFHALLGYDPTLSIHINPPSWAEESPAAIKALEIKESLENVAFHIKLAQENHEHYYNKKMLLPPKLNPGDKVWLSARNIKTNRPSKKLDHRNLGPFTIIEPVGSRSFRLDLPPSMKIHNVFHVNLLEK